MIDNDLLIAVKLATATQVVKDALDKVLTDEEVTHGNNDDLANTLVRIVVTESNR